MRGLRILCLTLGLAAACGGKGADGSRPLVANGEGFEISWPTGCEPSGFRFRDAADLADPPAAEPRALARLRLGEHFDRDERLAYLAPAGSIYRFPLPAGKGDRFRFELGRIEGEGAVEPLTLRARLVSRDGEITQLLERQLAPDPKAYWKDVNFELPARRDGQYRVELEASGNVPAAACAENLAAWANPRIERAPPKTRRPNIVWISVDTLRADRLTSYGGPRPTSPELDRLGERGLRFEWAISQAPWTKPSHRAMLSGLYPLSRSGIESPYLGSELYAGGYRTFAVTGAGQLDSSQGFDRGFEIYRISDWIHEPESIVDWTAQRAGDDPFFLFLHTYEAHEPYTFDRFARDLPSGRFSGEFSKAVHDPVKGTLTDDEKRWALAMYDGDIAYTDGQLGRLFRDLDRRGLFESTILIVTSDHGEQFWEHGTWGHGQSLYDHQIRVPLFVVFPPNLRVPSGRVESEQVELIDLYPTLLDFAGLAMDHAVQGRSIRPLLEKGQELAARQAFAEGTNIKSFEMRALRTPRYKFILWEPRGGRGDYQEHLELFDLRADPHETVNLAERHTEVASRLKSEVLRRVAGADANRDEVVPANADAELRKQLEALGYVGN